MRYPLAAMTLTTSEMCGLEAMRSRGGGLALAGVLPPPAAKAPGTTYLLSPPLADPTAAPTIAGAGSLVLLRF